MSVTHRASGSMTAKLRSTQIGDARRARPSPPALALGQSPKTRAPDQHRHGVVADDDSPTHPKLRVDTWCSGKPHGSSRSDQSAKHGGSTVPRAVGSPWPVLLTPGRRTLSICSRQRQLQIVWLLKPRSAATSLTLLPAFNSSKTQRRNPGRYLFDMALSFENQRHKNPRKPSPQKQGKTT